MVPKTIHEYESTHAAKEHGLTKSATSPIQKVRKILDTTPKSLFSDSRCGLVKEASLHDETSFE